MGQIAVTERCGAGPSEDRQWAMEGTHLRNRREGGQYCLRAVGGFSRYARCDDADPAQSFEFVPHPAGSGRWQILPTGSNTCVDSGGADTIMAGLVHLLPCDGGPGQTWELSAAS